MPPTGPAVVGRHHLDEAAARRLWNWQLRRQGLAEDTRLDTVAAIAGAALGLHAARLPSPYATVAARSTTPDVPLSLLQLGQDAVLTVRCMRKTLHALPPGLAAAAHAATVHFRERDARRAILNAGQQLSRIEHALELVVAILASRGRLPHRDLERGSLAEGVPLSVTRLAIKLGWERGQLTYANHASGWDRELRTFGLPAAGQLGAHLTRQQATTTLVGAYYDRYGPATLADASWWSGLSRTAIITALADLGTEMVEVSTAWTDAPLLMFRWRLDDFLTAPPTPATGVNLLAHEDIALKAYHQSRQRYLAGLPARRAFNSIGEALPTVLHDGRIIGTWTWDRPRAKVTYRLVPALAPSSVRALVRQRASQLTATLRQGLSQASARRGVVPAG
jgi:hypothetical protein